MYCHVGAVANVGTAQVLAGESLSRRRRKCFMCGRTDSAKDARLEGRITVQKRRSILGTRIHSFAFELQVLAW